MLLRTLFEKTQNSRNFVKYFSSKMIKYVNSIL